MADLLARLRAALPPSLIDLLTALGREAAAAGVPLYLVGGVVRDLLLERPLKDLDVVVEGDAPALARRAAHALGGKAVVHPQFGTATLTVQGQRLDLATARTETYQHPGALPTVQPGTIHDDLRRRDFTVNALALRLSPPGEGELLDLFGGAADLGARRIRILHDASFRDDATRILRAVRYEQRLGLAIESHTLALLRDALAQGMMDTISGDRVRNEVALVLEEPDPTRPLLRAADLGVWAAGYPPLDGVPALRAGVAALCREPSRAPLDAVRPLVYVALLSLPLATEQAERLVQRLNMPTPWARVTRDAAAIAADARLGRPDTRPIEVCDALDSRAVEATEAAALADPRPEAQAQARCYLDEWRHVRPALDGHALLALGVPQGPLVGRLLRELRTARLEGHVATREEEETLVRRRLGEEVP